MPRKNKIATVSTWSHAIALVNDVHSCIQRMRIKRKKCYIGQEATFPIQVYYAITPASLQDAGILAWALKALMETGYHDLWRREFSGHSAAYRVQDRSRVKGQTKIVEEHSRV